MYQAGTLSGNPLAMAAGVATLKQLKEPGVYEALEKTSSRLAIGLQGAATVLGLPVTFTRVGSMMGMFFTEGPVTNFAEARRSDLKMFAAYYNAMLDRGIYLAPSQFEAAFVSTAHTQEDIDETVRAAAEAFGALGGDCEC
jgi:glutamate-1-semialdehyde 2,1-aminomutase